MALTVQSAAQKSQLSLLRSLLNDNPGLLNSQDADERTALHWAALGSVEIVRYLLDCPGIDIEKTDASGWTALHIAVSAGDEDIVRQLVGAGADVNRRTEKGLTPLHYAASKSRLEIGKFLIERGADINAKDKANQVPLHRAATTGSVGFVKLLLNSPEGSPKTRLNTADRIGNTPLHLAMDSAHAEAACTLIEAGADRGRTNVEDEIPETMEGVGGVEQKRARQYVIDRCGQP